MHCNGRFWLRSTDPCLLNEAMDRHRDTKCHELSAKSENIDPELPFVSRLITS